jgi:hypothetical protein
MQSVDQRLRNSEDHEGNLNDTFSGSFATTESHIFLQNDLELFDSIEEGQKPYLEVILWKHHRSSS